MLTTFLTECPPALSAVVDESQQLQLNLSKMGRNALLMQRPFHTYINNVQTPAGPHGDSLHEVVHPYHCWDSLTRRTNMIPPRSPPGQLLSVPVPSQDLQQVKLKMVTFLGFPPNHTGMMYLQCTVTYIGI